VRLGAAIGAVALVVLVVAWTLTHGGPGTTAASSLSARRPAPSPTPAVAPTPIDPPSVRLRRNVFRFADERRAEDAGPADEGAVRRLSAPPPSPAPAAVPRLVGLLSEGGRVVAALVAEDGEVELAGPGETAAGVLVVAISEDSVRVRRSDGTETAIPLP
jgi:hypothetical protein